MNDQRDAETDRPAGAEQGHVLNNWKEIAGFLGVSVRTAHRWESTTGMPVRRAASGHAYAIAEELEQWRRGGLEEPPPTKSRWAIAAAGMLVLAACAYVGWRVIAVGPLTTVSVDPEGFRALDSRGRELWSARLAGVETDPADGWEVSRPERTLVADIDGDGEPEVVVSVRSGEGHVLPGHLICYSRTGQIRWTTTLGRAIKDEYGDYEQNFLGHILRQVHVGRTRYVLSVAAQNRWHPCQVALFDASTGKPVEEFWHPGALTQAELADVDGDGVDELLLAGVNNPGPGYGIPVAMLMKLPFSKVPVQAESRLAEYSSGGPAAYVTMPRADVLSAQGGVAAVRSLAVEAGGTVVMTSRYSRTATTPLTYRFNARLRFQALFIPGEFEAAHGVLTKSGAIAHPFGPADREALEHVQSFTFVPNGNALPPAESGR